MNRSNWARSRRLAIFLWLFASAPVVAQSEPPLSAIDWLSDTIAEPATGAQDGELGLPQSAATPEISVQPIDRATPDAAGLLPTSESGLPADLWGASSTADLARSLSEEPRDMPPAMQRLLRLVLLAELNPPFDSAGDARLFLARIDRLLELGLISEADALLRIAGPTEPEFFRRWFDIALLKATENEACELLRGTPDLSPTYQARIFCLARGGDWAAAALTLRNAETLGLVTPQQDELLSNFLEDGAYEGAEIPPAPRRPSPLEFRIYEAVGERLPTGTLPVAFAHADLFETNGWKTRLEAAERLARTGALEPQQLFELYAERKPAASGGVWERASAAQYFERALVKGDADEIGEALQNAWDVFKDARLHMAFAEHYSPRLFDLSLPGEAGGLALRIGLLSSNYEEAANSWQPANSDERLLIATARGVPQTAATTDPEGLAIQDGFSSTGLPPRYAPLVASKRLGEAVLLSLRDFAQGAQGDLDQMRDALAFFRLVGLETTARRAALEVLILGQDV